AAFAILEQLERTGRDGKGLPTAKLAHASGLPEAVFAATLADLRFGRFVVQSDAGHWILTRDLDRTPLSDLVEIFGFGLGFGLGMETIPQLDNSETGRRVAAVLRAAAESEQQALSVTLG